MLLPRLGVGNVLLIDNDIVDATNLNRLHGARHADADAMRPKVEGVGRAITELGLRTRVVTKEAWVGDPERRDALRSCVRLHGRQRRPHVPESRCARQHRALPRRQRVGCGTDN
jgi:ThiF family